MEDFCSNTNGYGLNAYQEGCIQNCDECPYYTFKSNENMKEIQKNAIFSETSHYKFIDQIGNRVNLVHLESGDTISIDREYLDAYAKSGDTYNVINEVGREDKKDGTPGIRSIFDSIHSSQVFTVCFKKQDKPKTVKQIYAEKEQQRQVAIEMIDKAKKQKKSMAMAYKEALLHIQENPINSMVEGEDRVLRGYKIQFQSRDGRYSCMDMDINEVRPVNINSLKWLIFNGVKYIVE